MAKRTFCQEPTGRSCARSIDGDHGSRSCSRSTKRDWIPDANRFARNDHRLLRRRQFSSRPYCAVFRTTHGKGLRWGSRACSVLLADADHNLSARTMISEKLQIPNVKSQANDQIPTPKMENGSKPRDLENRTFRFAELVRAFVKELPGTVSNIEDIRQLVRASGSVAANWIEADEALSKKD